MQFMVRGIISWYSVGEFFPMDGSMDQLICVSTSLMTFKPIHADCFSGNYSIF